MADIMTQYNGYEPGQTPDLLYPVNGVTTDWTYASGLGHEPILSFTNEIGTTGFWPSFSERDQLFQENVWPMLYLMMAAGYTRRPGRRGHRPRWRPARARRAGRAVLHRGQPGRHREPRRPRGHLSCDDPYVQFAEVSRSVGSLAPMGEATWSPAALHRLPACPDGHLVQVGGHRGHHHLPAQLPGGQPDTRSSSTTSPTAPATGPVSGGPWGLTTTPHSAPYALTDSPSGDYGDNLSATATIDGEFLASELRFWHRYDIEDGWDYGRVQVSADGSAWQTVESYTGSQFSWQQVSLDLTPYAGGGPVQVRFMLDSDTWITEDGWYIDDVMLLGAGNDNALPPSPPLLAPADGVTVDAPVQLTVGNVTDPEGADVSYGFRVYADAALTQLVASTDGVPADDGGQTSWTASLDVGTYHWRAYAADDVAWGPLGETRTFTVGDVTAAGDVLLGDPRLAVLGQGGARAELQLSLPRAADVSVKIYNARGMLVRDLFDGSVASGERVLAWDGRDAGGRQVASGVYLVRATAGADVLTGRVVMVR